VLGISKYFTTDASSDDSLKSGMYLQLIIALSTIYLSRLLLDAERWLFFSAQVRTSIADYGVTIAVVICSSIAYMGENKNVSIHKLETPNSFGTTNGRGWLIDLGNIPLWGIFASILPGKFVCYVLNTS
jgi:hypothetical protein